MTDWWRNNYLAYVRVSSYEQSQRNISIPSQVDQINNYAKTNNIFIKKIFTEENSAFKHNRPIFAQMLQELQESKDIQWVVVFKFDRLSRNLDDFLRIDSIIREKSLEIVSVTEPMLNSYLGRYLVRDMQNRAILYSEELSFRIKLGLRKKLQNWWAIGWWVPFWFKRVNGYFIPDEAKAPIVKEVFDLYSTGAYSYSAIAKVIKDDFSYTKITHRHIENIIKNTIYYGSITKHRKISKEEYLFRWLADAWSFTEVYETSFIKPIITKDLFDRCASIRSMRHTSVKGLSWKSKFPALFQCVCWRSMSRDDKKKNRYLRCMNHINNKFSIKCNEKYTNLKVIEPQVYAILDTVLPSNSIIHSVVSRVNKELRLHSDTKNNRLLEVLHEIATLKQQLSDYTDWFIDGVYDKDAYDLLVQKINGRIKAHQTEVMALEDDLKYTEAWHKVIKFMEVLKVYSSYLNISDNTKKSSQCFGTFFKVITNSTLAQWNIRSYLLNPVFDIVKKFTKSSYWSTSKELRTFFIRVPYYDINSLCNLEYKHYSNYLGKSKT